MWSLLLLFSQEAAAFAKEQDFDVSRLLDFIIYTGERLDFLCICVSSALCVDVYFVYRQRTLRKLSGKPRLYRKTTKRDRGL